MEITFVALYWLFLSTAWANSSETWYYICFAANKVSWTEFKWNRCSGRVEHDSGLAIKSVWLFTDKWR